MLYTITEAENGMLLREYLRKTVGVSAALLTRLKKQERGILLNGERVTVRAVLHTGDSVELAIEDTQADENPYVAAVARSLTIVHEEESFLVVDKPPDMVTHTSHGHREDSLANALCAYYHERGISFVLRAVNRLDRETGGLVLVARNQLAAHRLSRALQSGEVHKEYIAIVSGEMYGEGEIRGYVTRCGDSIITRRTCESDEVGAEYAHTVYRVLYSGERCSVVMAKPITGRTHQLRVHFASLGHPIIGDSLYGVQCEQMPRQALQAVGLSFPHPFTGVRMSFRVALPQDMQSYLLGEGISPSLFE